jgi:mevalonate kinase
MREMEFAHASAPARVCFGGEDLDWLGGPSLLGAIDLRLTVHAYWAEDEAIHISSGWPIRSTARLPLDASTWRTKSGLDHVAAAIRCLETVTGPVRQGMRLQIDSQFPAQAGLSSSAAVTLATIAAVSYLQGVMLPLHEVMDLAWKTEREMLKTGAGPMDFQVCGRGGIVAVDPDGSPVTTQLPYRDMQLIVVDTDQPRRTGDVIAHKRLRHDRGEPQIIRYQEEAREAVHRMIRLIHEADFPAQEFGSLMTQLQNALREHLTVSSRRIEEVCAVAAESGAFGAKLVGTGLGGCVLILSDQMKVDETAGALAAHPFSIYRTATSPRGLDWGDGAAL